MEKDVMYLARMNGRMNGGRESILMILNKLILHYNVD